MSALFTINFRREAYVREATRRRRRVIALGIWVAYFGVLLVLIGLYALNGFSLLRRSLLLERQSARIRSAKYDNSGSQLAAGELTLVGALALSTRQWRDRMERLALILPPEARLSALTVNPQNMSDPQSRNALTLRGELKGTSGDRMQGVMKIVSSLRADSLFGLGYHNIKLSSTSISDDGNAEFEIECR